MTHFMRRVGLTVAVLGLVIVAACQARADLAVTYTGSFTGLSDQAGYSVQPGGPFTTLPATPFTAGFTYADNGTSTSLTVFVNGPPILGPDQYNSDMISESDSGIVSGSGLIPQFIHVGQNNDVSINATFSGGGTLLTLSGLGHLLADNTVDAATFEGKAFWGAHSAISAAQ